MVTRYGRFILFPTDNDCVVYLDVASIVYIETDYKTITISTNNYEWSVEYDSQLFYRIIDCIKCD